MSTHPAMSEPERIGLADLRQNASEVVKRVENGGEYVVTVAGRPAARLVGLSKKVWVPAFEAETLLSSLPGWGPWERSDESFDDELRNPWEGRQ